MKFPKLYYSALEMETLNIKKKLYGCSFLYSPKERTYEAYIMKQLIKEMKIINDKYEIPKE